MGNVYDFIEGFRWNKLTAEELTSDEVLEALGDPELDKIGYEQNKAKLLERARELKRLTMVKDFLKAIEKDIKKPTAVQAYDEVQNYVVADLGQGDLAIPCGEWNVDYSGIWRINYFGRKMFACSKPVIIARKLFNVNNKKYKYEIAFRDKNKQLKKIAFACSWLLNANKVQGLADYGIEMTTAQAKNFTEYLSEFERVNNIPTVNSTDKLGWLGHDFIPYNNAVTFDAEAQFQEVYDSISNHSGSEEAWIEFVQKLRATNKSEIFISLAASFASPLLSLVNALPFICNLYGTSGKGKTVCLHLAASIWANSRIYVSDSNNTLVANEILLHTYNNLPLMLDDFSKISSNQYVKISDIIYSLCSGIGKNRSNQQLTINDQKRWQCAILTNMERPLVEDNTRGGSINRVLDFQIGAEPIFADGNKVVTFLEDNYGFVGETYIEELTKLKEKDPDYIRQRYRYWMDQIYNFNGKKQNYSDKQVASLALMFVGDELSEKFIFKDGLGMCKNPDKYIWQLKTVKDIDEGRRGYEFVLQCAMRDINMFSPADDGTYKGKVGGKIEGISPTKYVLDILVEQFRTYMKEGNFSEKTTLDWIVDNNLLFSYAKGKRRMYKVTLVKNYAPYCYRLVMIINAEDSEFVDASKEELPFD